MSKQLEKLRNAILLEEVFSELASSIMASFHGGTGDFRSAPFALEDISEIAAEPVQKSLQGINGQVLIGHFQPIQARIGNSQLFGELIERESSTFLAKEHGQLLSELAHPRRMCEHLSRIWDFLIG
jgi:hypothetical protein